MNFNEQDNSAVFDFLKDFNDSDSKENYLADPVKNLVRLFELTLNPEKIAVFCRIGAQDTELLHNSGFSVTEISGFTRCEYINSNEVQPSMTHEIKISGLADSFGINTFDAANNRYSFILGFNKKLTSTEKETALKLVESFSLNLHVNSPIYELREQFNELILQNMISAIVVINKSGHIVFINRSAEMILGYKSGELKNVHCSKIFREIEDDKNWLTFALSTGTVSSREKIHVIRKDNIEIAVGGSTSLLKSKKGEVVGAIGIFREFEDFQRTENKRKDLNKVSLLAKLSASIAHEIRNPLAGISATAQVLASRLADDDRKKRFVMVILEEIDRINKVIKELLVFSSPTKSSFLRSNINKLIEQAIDLVHKKLQRHGIDIVREYDSELPDVYCDENQIKQAVVNIMLNSINVMPEGGLLCVTTDRYFTDSRNWIRIIVKDTGPGIPKEVIKDLFLPFSSSKTYGLGLGLTITKSIIHSHKGKIEAVNLPQKGAQFVILLPTDADIIEDEQAIFPFEE